MHQFIFSSMYLRIPPAILHPSTLSAAHPLLGSCWSVFPSAQFCCSWSLHGCCSQEDPSPAFQILLPTELKAQRLFPRNLKWGPSQEADANTGFRRDQPLVGWLAVSAILVAGGEVTAPATSGTPRLWCLGWGTRGRKCTGWRPILGA